MNRIIKRFSSAIIPPLLLAAVLLPYPKGKSFIVTTGYNSPPTHVKKDAYAIDFTQNGCDAYGKAAVAAAAGTAWVVQEDGYNGGYGTQLLVVADGEAIGAGDAIVARYAHLIPDSIAVAAGDTVKRGMALGQIGDTGLVAGKACADHPGTHLHFALYKATAAGGALSTSTFTAHNPEPISSYTDIQEGNWYLSDNGPPDEAAAASGTVLGAAIEKQNLNANSSASSSSVSSTISAVAVLPTIPIGGAGIAPSVSASPPPMPAPSPPPQVSSAPPDDASSSATSTSAPPDLLPPNFTGIFNFSTLAVDFSWQPPLDGLMASSAATTYSLFDVGDASSTPIAVTISSTAFSYPVPNQDFGHDATFTLQAADGSDTTFTYPETDVAIPNWLDIIHSGTDDSSIPSWYDDNWYDLGTGLYGTVKSLTFRGAVDTDRWPQFGGGTMEIQEFLDADYTKPNQAFAISGNTPFTNQLATVTFGGLNIPLQPNKYYRLATVGPLQNHSVILAGTRAVIPATSTGGTAMWDEFVNGTGIMRHEYAFSPYMSAIMVPQWPPLAPPNPPASFSFSFDQFALTLGVGWPAAIDPDTTANLLTYEFNVSTSSVLNDTQWQPMGKALNTSISVASGTAAGDAYTIGVRATDDFGNVSVPHIETWHFPAGFVPYILTDSMSTASQDFMLAASTTAASGTVLHSIGLFTANLSSGSRYPEYNWCTLDLYDLAPASGTDTSSGGALAYLASNDGLNQGYGGCQGSPTFAFDGANAGAGVQLLPDHPYHWVFTMNTGNPSTQAAVQFWGTMTDTADGAFSNPAIKNAKFAISADSGVLFSN